MRKIAAQKPKTPRHDNKDNYKKDDDHQKSGYNKHNEDNDRHDNEHSGDYTPTRNGEEMTYSS